MTLAGIEVPDFLHNDVSFPLRLNYPFARSIEPNVVIHQFGAVDALVEQRYYVGDGLRKFVVRYPRLSPREHDALLEFWQDAQGGASTFNFDAPHEDGTFTTIRARFADAEITFDYLLGAISSVDGLTVVEVPTAPIAYVAAGAPRLRFPDAATANALLDQVQTMVPLLKIVTADQTHTLLLSDRWCTVGDDEYQPRIVSWGPIEQSLNGATDSAHFTLGNSDGVMKTVANTTRLRQARVEFSLLHADTHRVVNIWAGRLSRYSVDQSGEFPIDCDEGLPLRVMYPCRLGSRLCWKKFAGVECGWTPEKGTSTLRDILRSNGTTQTVEGDASSTSCDHTWDGKNGCVLHNNDLAFGGIVATSQTVRLRNGDSIGGILQTTSLIGQNIYSQAVPEVYCNVTDPDTAKGFPVQAILVEGRDESEFYDALGVVSEGPIGAYAAATMPGGHFDDDNKWVSDDPYAIIPFKLDGQPWHGPGMLGLRLCLGHDPAQAWEAFSLGESQDGRPSWYGPEYAAGTAFAEIRRVDQTGLQLQPLDQHTMEVMVRQGLGGWTWLAPGFRSWTPGLTDPTWITVNAHLRAIGLRNATIEEQEATFDVAAAVQQSTINNLAVPKLVGEGSEKQFTFTGIIRDQQPLRDWFDRIQNNCLGYYVWNFSRLKLGSRCNSSAVSAFTEGNVLWRSVKLTPIEPEFNRLHVRFSDAEGDYADNRVTYEDADAALEDGGGLRQEWHDGELQLTGASSKSEALRIGMTRVREEVGGVTAEQRAAARNVSLQTTVLALDVEAGMIVSLTHPDCPEFPASAPRNNGDPLPTETDRPNYLEFRALRWRLNGDFTVEIEGKSTHGDMYDEVAGPKPADVLAEPVLGDDLFKPGAWHCEAWTYQDGLLRLKNFQCGEHSATVRVARLSFYYTDESASMATLGSSLMGGTVDTTATTFTYFGLAPTEGEWVLHEDELMEVVSVTPTPDTNYGHITVKRGVLGTAAGIHSRNTGTLTAIDADNKCKLTLSDGDNGPWRPGAGLVVDRAEPPFPQRVVGSVEAGNVATILLPYDDADSVAAGETVYQDPRLWRVKKLDVEVALPPGFFKSPKRAKFEYDIPLQNAGVVMATGFLENSRGLQSAQIHLFPTSSQYMAKQELPYHPAWPHRVRTVGNAHILMPQAAVAKGQIGDRDHGVFLPVPTSHAQCFEWALATAWKGSVNAVDTPNPVQIVTPCALQPTGHVTFGGAIDSRGQIQIRVIGNTEAQSPVFSVGDHPSVTNASTLATALAVWLNADATFSSFVNAKANGATLDLTDLIGRGGAIEAALNKTTITAAASGFTSRLGILRGRRYGICAVGAGYRSDISLMSPTTGPTGDATRVEIRDIPYVKDSRVSEIEVYAYPDGDELSQPHLVGSSPNGSGYFSDTTTEADLAALPTFEAPTQPRADGPVTITITRNQADWFRLYIPPESNISNQVHGFAIDSVPPDVEINAWIVNEASDGMNLLIEFC